MTTANYPVTSSPYVVFQSGQNQPRYGLTNVGSSTIYVSSTPQQNSTDGWPLNPAATMPWPASTYLSVVCATGATSTLQTIDADVGLFDPAAIAEQTNLVGVPPIDQPALIYSRTLAGATAVASGVAPPDTAGIDCTRYQGIYISGQDAGINNLTTNRTYTLTWYADSTLQAGNNAVLAIEQLVVGTYSATYQVARPVRGAFLVISQTSAATVTPCAQILRVYGTMRNVDPRTYITTGKNNSTGLFIAPTLPLAGILLASSTITGAGTTRTDWSNALMGCNASFSTRSTATLSDIIGFDLQTIDGQSYRSWELTPSVAAVNETFWIPPMPFSISIINFSTGTPDYQIGVVVQPQ